MIGPRQSLAHLGLGLLMTAVATVGFLAPAFVHAKPGPETPEEANAFLDRFIGHWIGGGTASGTPIREDFESTRVLDGTFLFMQNREIGGDFKADTYVGYRVEKKRYELYTFNNNTAFGSSLPVRLMTGRRDGDRLVMEEQRDPQALRYTFEFLDENTFRLTKEFVTGHPKQPPLVVEIFRRQP